MDYMKLYLEMVLVLVKILQNDENKQQSVLHQIPGL